MRIGIGVPNTQRKIASSGPPVPSGWLADALTLPLTNGNFANLSTGLYFDVPSVQTCTGILINWFNTFNPATNVALTLYDTVLGIISSETIALAGNGLASTTVAFGSHLLTPGITYCIATYEVTGNYYNGFVNGNPFGLPKSYPKYTVTQSWGNATGFNMPVNFAGFMALTEPILL